MPVIANTPEALGKAIKNGEDEIIINGELKKKIIKIFATGKAAWAVSMGAIGISVSLVIFTAGSDGSTTSASAKDIIASLTPAMGILGIGTALSAVLIAIAAGGVEGLVALRNKYHWANRSGETILIRRKSSP